MIEEASEQFCEWPQIAAEWPHFRFEWPQILENWPLIPYFRVPSQLKASPNTLEVTDVVRLAWVKSKSYLKSCKSSIRIQLPSLPKTSYCNLKMGTKFILLLVINSLKMLDMYLFSNEVTICINQFFFQIYQNSLPYASLFSHSKMDFT